jgi:polar amino acid transport system substrate-binding protein
VIWYYNYSEKFVRAYLYSILAGLVFTQYAAAEDIAILDIMDAEPMTKISEPKKGLVGEITIEALRRAGYLVRIHDLPSARALGSVPGEKNVLIIPLAKVKSRVENFTWIFPIVKLDRAFYTLGKPVSSIENAQKKYNTVVVSMGTAGAAILAENGFTAKQIIEVSKGAAAPGMLLAGRADAWYNSIPDAKEILKIVAGGDQVNAGAAIGSTIHYLGCSKKCDPKMVAKIKKAFKAMIKDGTIKKIAANYKKVDGLSLVKELQ